MHHPVCGGEPITACARFHRADELKGDLSFLSSDVLQGRFTPSPELDIAAEFIASKFRAAGLEPGGNRGYFQTVEMVNRHMPAALSALRVTVAKSLIVVPASAIEIRDLSAAARVLRAPVLAVAAEDGDNLDAAKLRGKVVMVAQPESDRLTDQQKTGLRALHETRCLFGCSSGSESRPQKPRPHGPACFRRSKPRERRVPEIAVASERLWNILTQSKKTPRMTLSVRLGGPDDRKVVLKNVVGILRGSDPVLKNSCVLLTAHYDHIGTVETAGELAVSQPKDASDRIYNGANDDGSGTVSVIEIARAMARLNPRPRRSIVFMTFFGEELGELGAQVLCETSDFSRSQNSGRPESGTIGPNRFDGRSATGERNSDRLPILKRHEIPRTGGPRNRNQSLRR